MPADEFNPRRVADATKQRAIRHDIRGCLNAVMLSVAVLKSCCGQEDFDTYLGTIEAEVLKVEQLLKSAA